MARAASRVDKDYSAEAEAILTETIASFYDDPLGFVLYTFPWGVEGTELEDEPGPDVWQAQQLIRIGDAIKMDPEGYQIQEAIASGHSIGKSCEVSWLVLWAMSTRPHIAAVVTANTDTQLKTKTWKEVAKWHKMARNGHWFEWTATRLTHVDHPETWYAAAIPNSEQNSESFAGTHATHVLVIFDEASAIPDKIWEVTEGAMTTPRAMWFAYGNPTKNSGRFRECFGKLKHRWSRAQIDSRTCRKAEIKKIREWEEDWGEDSDFFRVRVRGEFPRSGSTQLISSEALQEGRNRQMDITEYIYFPIVVSVDVARFGDDETVISVRQGRKLHEQIVHRGLGNIQVASRSAEVWRRYKNGGGTMGPIMVDGIGLGSGVVDYLNDSGYPIVDVNVGAVADEPSLYFNKRAECYMRMKEWFDSGVDIPNDPELSDQAVGIQYEFDMKERVRIEKKADMKARGMSSPDRIDSLALSFAEIVLPAGAGGTGGGMQSFEPDYA